LAERLEESNKSKIKKKKERKSFEKKIKKTVSRMVFDRGFSVGRRVNAETGT